MKNRNSLSEEQTRKNQAVELLEKQIENSSENVNQLISQQQETEQFYNKRIEVGVRECLL